jgi:hypothetical protein
MSSREQQPPQVQVMPCHARPKTSAVVKREAPIEVLKWMQE